MLGVTFRGVPLDFFEPCGRSLPIEKLDGGNDRILTAKASSLKAPNELDRLIAIAVSLLQPKLGPIYRLHAADRSFHLFSPV
jgi:hypothetical protein